MFDNYVGNKQTVSRLKTWLENKSDTSLILTGPKGLALRDLAEETAKVILETENLYASPDFLLIEPDSNGKIGVEDVAQIINKASYCPIKERGVVLVDSMESMTVQAQNKLLKTIEDEKNLLVIGVAYDGGILDTIKSRVLMLEFFPLSEEEFKNQYTGAEADMAYILSRGCPEAINDDLVAFYRPIVENIAIGEEKELVSYLHLLKEKDTDNFFTSRKDEVPFLLNALECAYTDIQRYLVLGETGSLCQPQAVYEKEQVNRKLELIGKERTKMRFPSYSKDDFFMFVVRLVA